MDIFVVIHSFIRTMYWFHSSQNDCKSYTYDWSSYFRFNTDYFTCYYLYSRNKCAFTWKTV